MTDRWTKALASNDIADWLKLPKHGRPTFEEYQKMRRAERWGSLQKSLAVKTPLNRSQFSAQFRPLNQYSLSPRLQSPTRADNLQRLPPTRQRRVITPPRGSLLQTQTPEQLEIERLKSALRQAKAQNQREMERSESGFRKWLVGIIGNAATQFALGGLRAVWTLATGSPPIF